MEVMRTAASVAQVMTERQCTCTFGQSLIGNVDQWTGLRTRPNYLSWRQVRLSFQHARYEGSLTFGGFRKSCRWFRVLAGS